MEKNKNKSAFPTQKGKQYGFGTDDTGMTLRDYFAAKAIQNHPFNSHHVTEIAQYCYGLADAMLKARENQ